MYGWRGRRSGLMDCRRRRRRINIVLNRPLQSRGERLLRRIMPIRRYRSFRAVIIRTLYRFRLSLMVVTPAIEVTAAITRVGRRLLIHYFWIAVAVSSSAFIASIRLWLRIISPRDSRHIVIGIDMSARSVATRTAESVLISTGYMSRLRMIYYRAAIHNSPIGRRNRCMEARRRI